MKLAVTIVALVMASDPLAGQQGAGVPNALTEAEKAAGWELLFDGKTTAGWRGYGIQETPAGWQVVDGALTRVADAGDLVTTREFASFELTLEWKVPPNGNSGIFYHATEEEAVIFQTAPEFQVLDDAGHPDGKSPLTSAGSAYGLYPAPRGAVRPAGEWNAIRLVVNHDRVEHWLNGRKVVEYTIGSRDWLDRVRKAKFAAWPAFGRAKSGLIGLQDHGDRVAYRNIKIRVLP